MDRPMRAVSAPQKSAHEAGSESRPADAPAVAVPKAGEKFTDEGLSARFGVPTSGSIRVGRDSRCIVLVRPASDRAEHTGTGHGAGISCTGQDSDPDGLQNQELSGNNLALSRSAEEGYAVLHFTRQEGMLVFDSRVECASHDFEVGMNSNGQPRVVIKFNLRAVGEEAPAVHQSAGDSGGGEESAEADAGQAAKDRVELELIDSPPLTPEEIAAIEDCFSDPNPRFISKEEFLSIVMDDKKLEEHIRRLES